MENLIVAPGRAPIARVAPEGISRVHFGFDPTNFRVEWRTYDGQLVAAADKWLVYHGFKEYLGDGTIDLDNDTLKIALFTSSSNAATLTTDVYGSLTNEVANGNGYTTGGATLSGVTWTRSTATTTLDCTDPSWTASGGSITARFAVIYDDTPTSPADPLICYSLLDNTPADVTATDGNTLSITIDGNGILDISGGDTP